MYCAMCGFKLANNARFCSSCGAPVEASISTEDKPVEASLPVEDKSLEIPQVEFDIVDHHICFDGNMVAHNDLRKQFSINASKHKAEFIKFYDAKVNSFDKLFGTAFPEIVKRIASSVEFGVSVLMRYGVDHIDADSLAGLAGERIIPDPIMAPFIKEAEKIKDRADQISQSRNIERVSRSKWHGGGFGLKGAIKGAMTAGALNAVTDTFRGMGDFLTELGDDSAIYDMQWAVYAAPDTLSKLSSGVYKYCFAVFYSVRTVLEKENLIPPMSFDISRQDARLNNYLSMYSSDNSIRPKLIDILCNCIQSYPFSVTYYTNIYMIAESQKETILPVARYFGLEGEYLESIFETDQARLKTIKAMPQITAADVENKITALNLLNSENPKAGASEALETLYNKSAIATDVAAKIDPSRFIITTDRSEAERIAEAYYKDVSHLFNKDHLFITKNIPEKKLAGALRKYVKGMSSDEFPLLLLDDTAFGSAKEGCLLTNKALYFPCNFTPVRVPLEIIINFSYILTEGFGGDKLVIKTKAIEYQYTVIYVSGDKANEGFIKLLNDILDSLTSAAACNEVIS